MLTSRESDHDTKARRRISGIVPPLSTPLTAEGAVDLIGLERLIGHVLEAGVDGLFALGSTGEAAYLDATRRRQVLERVVAVNAGQVPVLVGCIAPATWPVMEMAVAANVAGADGIVVAAPFYGRTHPEEIRDHFRLVREASSLPIIAYDIPVSVHAKLTSSLIADLAAERVITGLKDSSGDDAGMRLTITATRDLDFSVLTGSELTVDAALLMGADGAVPGLANIDPGGYVRLLTLCREGRWLEARVEQDRLARLSAILNVGEIDRIGRGSAGMSAFKTALWMLSIIDNVMVAPPLRQLDPIETDQVRAILIETGLL